VISVQEKVSDSVLERVNKRLDNIVESKNLAGVQVAKTMLDALKAQHKRTDFKTAVWKIIPTVKKESRN
jgi:hypothetical protein